MAAIPSQGADITITNPADRQVIALTRSCMQRLPRDHDVRVGADAIILTARRMTGSAPGAVLAAVIARR